MLKILTQKVSILFSIFAVVLSCISILFVEYKYSMEVIVNSKLTLILLILFFCLYFLVLDFLYYFLLKIQAKIILKCDYTNLAANTIIITSKNKKVMVCQENFYNFFNLTNFQHTSQYGLIKNRLHKVYNYINTDLDNVTTKRKNIDTLVNRKLLKLPGNSERIFSIALKKIKVNYFFPTLYIYIITDVSKRVEVNRFQTWSEEVKKMIHDIKTPLASIGLNIQTLRMKLKKSEINIDPVWEKNLSIIEQEAKRVNGVSQEFLQFSNLVNPVFNKINFDNFINNIINRFVSLNSENLNICYVNYTKKSSTVFADRRLLEIVFNILIENSLQASHGKCQIKIKVENISGKKLTKIAFIDNGPGMTADILKKVKIPYYTTKSSGSGLGIPMALKIIDDHGGKMEMNSKVNWGTVITILLKIG